MHLEVLEVERPQVELNDRTTDGADGGVTTLRAQHAQEIVEERTGDKVGDDIDRLAAGRRIDLRDQVARPAGDDGLRADGGDGLLLAATDDGIGYGIARPAKLYQTRADAARGAGDEDAIARGDPSAIEHVLAGQVGAAEGGEIGVATRCAFSAGSTMYSA